MRSKRAVVALNASSAVGAFLIGELLDCVRSCSVRLKSAHDFEDRVNAGESFFRLEKGLMCLTGESEDAGGFLENGVRSVGWLILAGADLVVVTGADRSIGGVWERLREAEAVVEVLWSRSKTVMLIFV